MIRSCVKRTATQDSVIQTICWKIFTQWR